MPVTRDRGKSEAGFTIVEVVMAISILSIGLLAMAKMQIMAIQGNSSAKWQAEQTTHAQDKMEELIALSYTHADLDSDPATNPHNEANPPDNYAVSWTVIDSVNPGGTGFSVPDTKLITVTLTGLNKTTVLTGIKPDF